MSAFGVLLAVFVFFGGIMAITCGGCLYLGHTGTEALSEVAKQVEAEQKKIRDENKQKIVGSTGSATKNTTGPSTRNKAISPKEVEYAGRSSVLKIGTIQARILSVKIATVPIKGLGQVDESEEHYLVLKISLRNTSTTKRIKFHGWPGPASSNRSVTAKDEHDNDYGVVDFGFSNRPIGDATGETIEPSGEVAAIVAFEQPIDSATSLRITLNGDALGLEESVLKWKLDRSDWTP